MAKIKYPNFPVLIVDDDVGVIKGCQLTLRSCGISNIVTCLDSGEVMPLLARQKIQVILLDLVMPNISGEELLRKIAEQYPHIPVVVLTGINEVETAINCMKTGAFDYMVKPVEEQRLVSVIRRAVEKQEERAEYQEFKQLVLKDALNYPQAFSEIITINKAMRSIFQYTEAIAKTNKPVLITGDSGVGKGLIAKAIHFISLRKGSFISVNTSGLDDNLFSDSMFGHKKGAYTSAADKRQGLVEQAAAGTLFLDEIGDLSIVSQTKLLRLLGEGEYFPIGADNPKRTDARFRTSVADLTIRLTSSALSTRSTTPLSPFQPIKATIAVKISTTAKPPPIFIPSFRFLNIIFSFINCDES
jgi:DNA-binding NtrC family response regulator